MSTSSTISGTVPGVDFADIGREELAKLKGEICTGISFAYWLKSNVKDRDRGALRGFDIDKAMGHLNDVCKVMEAGKYLRPSETRWALWGRLQHLNDASVDLKVEIDDRIHDFEESHDNPSDPYSSKTQAVLRGAYACVVFMIHVHNWVEENRLATGSISRSDAHDESKIELTGRKLQIMQAIYQGQHESPDNPIKTDELADKLEINSVQTLKHPLAELKKAKMLGSKRASGGGYWLTSEGVEWCERDSINW